jgi:drug/metabolite transporter (DMT)-like permease
VCSVLYRPYLRRYPALPVSLFAMLASVVFLAALALGDGFFGAAPALDKSGWLAVVFIGVSSGVGYFCWLWALGHTTPTRVTIFLALSPLTATILGALLLAEGVSVAVGLGMACVIVGLWLAHRRPER